MLYECHGHIIADGVSYQDAMARHQNGVDQSYVHKTLEQITSNGVGYYRDGGDKYGVSAYAKTISEEYGLTYRTPVFIVHKTGHYGAMYGRSYDNLRDYYALVREASAQGADFIKLTVTGMLDFADGGKIMGPVSEFSELREAVHIASEEGFRVMAHCNGADSVKHALEAGVSSIEHGFWPDESVVGHFLQADAVWVPTCAAVYNLIGKGRYDDAVLKCIFDTQRDVLIKAHQRGVKIASGSDCGASAVMQGQGTLDEYAILKSMEIDPENANKAVAERFIR